MHSAPHPANPPHNLWAIIATVLFSVAVFLWHMQGLGTGGLSQFDEFYTYERSIGFARQNDWWSVYSSNSPTLKKPPLQYWMSGGLMQFGVSDVIALRLPSAVFSFGAFVVTAMIANALVPSRPWAMLGSVALLATSLEVWSAASSAMLDGGAMVFTAFGIWAMIKALDHPKFWLVFVFATFLAGLQKGPTPLGFFVFAMIGLAVAAVFLPAKMPVKMPQGMTKRRLLGVFALGLAVAFLWQFFQLARYGGPEALSGNFEGEMIGRFAPSLAAASGQTNTEFFALLFGGSGEAPVRILGILALAALPFQTKRFNLVILISIVVLFFLTMWMASGNVYGRYVLVLLPLLCAALASSVFLVPPSQWIGVGAIVGVVALSGGPIKPFSALNLEAPDKFGATIEEILAPSASLFDPDVPIVICAIDRATRIPRGAITVHGIKSGGFRYDRDGDAIAREARDDPKAVLQGICTPQDFEIYAPDLTDVVKTPLAGVFFFWKARIN